MCYCVSRVYSFKQVSMARDRHLSFPAGPTATAAQICQRRTSSPLSQLEAWISVITNYPNWMLFSTVLMHCKEDMQLTSIELGFSSVVISWDTLHYVFLLKIKLQIIDNRVFQPSLDYGLTLRPFFSLTADGRSVSGDYIVLFPGSLLTNQHLSQGVPWRSLMLEESGRWRITFKAIW